MKQYQETISALHPLEAQLLLTLNKEEFSLESLRTATPMEPAQLNQALSFLQRRGLLEELSNEKRLLFAATPRAKEYHQRGLPERHILSWLHKRGDTSLAELSSALGVTQAEVGSAFGKLLREQLVVRKEGGRIALASATQANNRENYVTRLERLIDRGQREEIAQANLNEEEQRLMLEQSKKRGAAVALFRRIERYIVSYRLNHEGLRLQEALRATGVDGNEIGRLTPQMLRDGSWREQRFRTYNISIPPSRVLLGRSSPYADYLRWVKDKLVALGFEEFDGPLVESEFWNCDALYMPQFHSARDTHDVYYVAEPQQAREIDPRLLERVAQAHEYGGNSESRGWCYHFDRQFTKRLILRSQGTALSARQLPQAKIPGKYFGIVRCFRYDQVDATHLSDFYQTEGIILGEEVNLRTLLGLLKLFAEEIAGAQEVRYVPGYFPFTEPSIEVHIKHPTLGWFELGGSGIFRPEVTQPLGVEVPVLAWGLGIDRMALMKLGLNDLRDLFAIEIEKVRLQT